MVFGWPGFLEDKTLVASYIVAALAMLTTVFYLFLRLRAYVTTTYMLVVALLLIYGPASLIYTLTSGRPHFVISWLFFGVVNTPHEIFDRIKSKISDFDAVVVSMNFSLTLMYAGVIAGIEAVNRLAPARVAKEEIALSSWSSQPLQDEIGAHRLLLAAISALALFMLYVSIAEHHLATIIHFFSIKDNDARDLFRAHFGGSQNYLYRAALSALAPMFVIWGIWAGLANRSPLLVLAALVLLACTLIGKVETLSKAPPAFFILQLLLAAVLTLTNRISWKLLLFGGFAAFIFIYLTIRLVIIFPEGMEPLFFVFTRLFEVQNQTLLEYFATFPHMHPHLWGANIRPLAALFGVPYTPSFSTVAYTWFGLPDITNPALFIADAWADFSYAGVLVFSILVGAICRAIDVIFLANGKSVVAIAVLGATFLGIFTLLTTALNIALLSGGLLLAPALAAILIMAGRYLAGKSVRTAQGY
jgi:hypothetical protein